MTIDTLAIAIQKDFNDVRGDIAIIHTEMATMRTDIVTMRTDITTMRAEMVTKAELRSMKDEILGEVLSAIKDLKKIVQHNDGRLSAYMARTGEDIKNLQDTTKKIDVRLRIIEKRG